MLTNENVLYRSTKRGEVSVWAIWSESHTIFIETRASETSSSVMHTEEVVEGKAGRTVEVQIKSRIDSRVKVKMDHGYSYDRNKATSGEMTNQLNLYMPMLAERFKNIKAYNIADMLVQPKLDGHRCLIARIGNEYIAYSRRGIQILTIDHILDNIIFPDGYILDGELYHHGTSLQTIASWTKRKQVNTSKLSFMCYDVITPDADTYEERLRFLMNEVLFNDISNSQILRTLDGAKFQEGFSMGTFLQNTIDKGYEGVILRPKNGIYHIGRRHKDLIKVKQWFDDDFKIVNIHLSKTEVPVLDCITENGLEFKATAPGNAMQKMRAYQKKHLYIGTKVTIEYPNLTDKGIPFQPVAVRYVTEI